jgi:two-component system sensor histidine kinase GlrK
MTLYMNKLAEQSEIIVSQATSAAQGGRALFNELEDMHGSALRYMVLQEGEFLASYRIAHGKFQDAINALFPLDLAPDQRVTLIKVGRKEHELFEEFGSPFARPASGEKPIVWFDHAKNLAEEFIQQSDDWVDREVGRLQNLADSAGRMLTWMIVAMVPIIFILAGVFTAFIVRPLQAITNAIRRLGEEDYETPIVVSGPHDVEMLGERLDWLRMQLVELDDQKVRFLRHMSHELKTPLTGLREGAELLADEVVGSLNEDQRQVVSIMRENAKMFQSLIENLVNFNHALSRDLEMHFEPVFLEDVIRQVVESQKLAWKAKELRINMDLVPLCPMVDRPKMMTVIDNLVSNAIKYSPQGSDIAISLKPVGGNAVIEVSDAGPGFRPEDQQRVFEAFYQGHIAPPDSHVKGSGLGLAIAHQYTEAHSGTIEIVPDSSGGRIRVSLPMDQETEV